MIKLKELRNSERSKKILFLYTELSGYILNCLIYANKKGYEIHIIKYSLNNEAPFDFPSIHNINFYNREDFKSITDFKNLIFNINPKLIFISGWIDKLYLKVIKILTNNSKNILMIDTHWKGSIKQKLWAYYFRLINKKYFDYIWIPGKPQYKYAKKLGFENSKIYDGLYTCDEDLFNNESLNKKVNSNSKIFLFVGRYIKEKGLPELWETFLKLNSEIDEKWQLWCIGTGNLWKDRVMDVNIKHFGFIQPRDLPDIISECDVYILPSKFEPWAVSLHEMTSFGKAVLVSENVGSSYCFVKNNINGFIFSFNETDDFINNINES